ncbi:MAG: glycoside hydrolase family 3 N-terminal domain-containing protein [Acidimicrobiales bacterium]|nr:glycoside hydrolase family 3 N-terminal domain-containing protein [Acidimicrobiales bacterium]
MVDRPLADQSAACARWRKTSVGVPGQKALQNCLDLVRAYLEGLQQGDVGPTSVACMTKHFPGAGPQMDGEDAHFPYGREQVYPGDNFEEHLRPFIAAIEAGTSALMPYYGMPVGLQRNGVDIEEVGFAFNGQIITDLLRDELGFQGVICTDWSLIHEKGRPDFQMPPKAWGVEHLSYDERLLRLIDAGCDQMGGELCTDLLIGLVEAGRVTEARIDESVARLLAVKFDLGLFDDPYVDVAQASAIAGRDDFVAAGLDAQRRSVVLLTNDVETLPLAPQSSIYIENVDPDVAAEFGTVVDDPAGADIAIVRTETPYEERSGHPLDFLFHQGSLEFPHEETERLAALGASVPLVVDVRLDRAAVVAPLLESTAALTGTFGSSDRALLDVLFGKEVPGGRLPFELPSSMEAVVVSHPDVANDTANPTFPAGHGLSYG